MALHYVQCVAQLPPRETDAKVLNGDGDDVPRLWEFDASFEKALRDRLVGEVGKVGFDISAGDGEGAA